MKKTAQKPNNKYFSLLMIPHGTGKIKTIKLSSLRLKLLSAFLLVLVFALCTSYMLYKTHQQNKALKEQLLVMEETNSMQLQLLNDKADALRLHASSDKKLEDLEAQFAKEYHKIAEAYISRNTTSNRISRSGDENSPSFMTDIGVLKDLLDNISEMSQSNYNRLADFSKLETKITDYLDSIPNLRPATGAVTSGFGKRKHPVYKKLIMHEGIDIDAPNKSDIRASAKGTVTYAGTKSGYGRCVIVDHGKGVSTLYAHCSKLLVKLGQQVAKSDVIAKVGNTGVSTGPHLHFEVLLNDQPVDPMKFLEK